MKKFAIVAALALGMVAQTADAATVLVTGANRGLGLEFTKQFAARGDTVIATVRDPSTAKDLQALAAKHKTIMIEKLDVLDHAGIKALAEKYKGKPVDILINNAGVLGSGAFGNLDMKEFTRVMETNVFGSLAMTEAFRPHLAASTQKKVVFMTSPAGTFNIQSLFKDGKMAGAPEAGKEAHSQRDIAVAEGGGFYYSMSKVAVNMAVSKLRGPLKKEGIAAILIAPNAVDTDMLTELGFKGPAMTAPDAIARFIKIIDSTNVQNQGKPVVQDGTVLDW